MFSDSYVPHHHLIPLGNIEHQQETASNSVLYQSRQLSPFFILGRPLLHVPCGFQFSESVVTSPIGLRMAR